MVQDMISTEEPQSIPEELYNLTQLAEVTLAAGRLSTTDVNEITEYINKEKCKQNKEQCFPMGEQLDKRHVETVNPDDMKKSKLVRYKRSYKKQIYYDLTSEKSHIYTFHGAAHETEGGSNEMEQKEDKLDNSNEHSVIKENQFLGTTNFINSNNKNDNDVNEIDSIRNLKNKYLYVEQQSKQCNYFQSQGQNIILINNATKENANRLENKRDFQLLHSDDESTYYSHKIFDRKKSRRSTISDNMKFDELSCSSMPSNSSSNLSVCSNSNSNSSDESYINVKRKNSDSSGISQPEDEHVCPECGKKYSTSSNLARHRQTHRSILDKKARRCPHCEKVYVSMPAFSMHVRTHNQACACPHCGKCFSRPWLLQGHIRTHTGEKPFKCSICSKAFADKSNLRAHIQTHSNTKPHSCGRCGKAFALKSYLYKHEESSCMRNHNKQEKERFKVQKSNVTKSTLASKILRKEINSSVENKSQQQQELPVTLNLAPSSLSSMSFANVIQDDSPNVSFSMSAPLDSSSLSASSLFLTSNDESKGDLISRNNSTMSDFLMSNDDNKSPKCYTTLTAAPVPSATAQDEHDKFTRISVIRPPIGGNQQVNFDSTLSMNYYQENPVDFSPRNNFSHSSKTSPFELTGSYALVA